MYVCMYVYEWSEQLCAVNTMCKHERNKLTPFLSLADHTHGVPAVSSARLVHVTLPEVEARVEILKIHTKGVPLGEDVDLAKLAADAAGRSGAVRVVRACSCTCVVVYDIVCYNMTGWPVAPHSRIHPSTPKHLTFHLRHAFPNGIGTSVRLPRGGVGGNRGGRRRDAGSGPPALSDGHRPRPCASHRQDAGILRIV